MKESLVALLYDELDAGERAEIEAHLASCAACRQEAGALRALRLELPAWMPPERELGFAIVDRTARTERVTRSAWALPAWGLAAAAALVLAATGSGSEPAGRGASPRRPPRPSRRRNPTSGGPSSRGSSAGCVRSSAPVR
jgi:anti-sigma factor RsiW